MTDHIPDATKKAGRQQIREVFLRNGARIEPDRDDLPDWVYESVFELLEVAAPAVQGEPVAVLHNGFVTLTEASLDANPDDHVSLYLAPQPAEQQPDVAQLVEAAAAALDEIEAIMHEAYNSAYPVCCGRAGSECCGSPDPEWDEVDQRIMDRLSPHQRALNAALAAHRKQGGK